MIFVPTGTLSRPIRSASSKITALSERAHARLVYEVVADAGTWRPIMRALAPMLTCLLAATAARWLAGN
jgi:hypothetical protein